MTLTQILETLQSSTSPHNLESLKSLHHDLLAQFASDDLSVNEIRQNTHILNSIHDAFMKRAIGLAHDELSKDKEVTPPDQLCWVLFGSGARSEQTLMTDQDNGLLYRAGSVPERIASLYVQRLAELGTHHLNDIGYSFCPGNVMATNKRWSKSFDSWMAAMDGHIKTRQPDDLKYLYIASDLRGLCGDLELAKEAKEGLFNHLNASSTLLRRLHEHIQEPKVSIGLLGHLITDRFGEQSGLLNIKIGFYVPLVNTLKYLAMRHAILAPSSLERLYALAERRVISEADFTIIEQAMEICLYFRWKASLNPNPKERDYLDPRSLSSDELERLKIGLKEAKTFQTSVIRKVDDYES